MKRLFALVFLTLFALPARAGDPEPTIHPIFGAAGAFDYCLGEQNYADGRQVSFALSPKKEINLGLVIPNAGFRKESHYDIALRLNAAAPRKIRARAINEQMLLLQMGGSPSFADDLREASSLSAGAGAKEIAFALPKMDLFLKTLDQCVTENRDKKFEETQAAAQPVAPPEAFPDSVKNLLTAAGLGPITPMPMSDIPPEKRPADYMWQTGRIMGGIRERPVPEGASLFDLIGLHMQGLKAKCDGAFKATIEREQKAPGLLLRVAEASCAPGKDKEGAPILVGLVFYTMPDGVFTVLTHEGYERDKTAIFGARDGVAKAMLEAAQKQGLKKS